jgi:microcystin-dependent protein
MGIRLNLGPVNVVAPTGAVFTMATSTVPAGYLECNGAAVSRTSYATLFGLISTNYGAGDGSTTFNLPDLRGEFIRGWDNGRGVDSGRTIGSFQDKDTSTAAHTHSPGAGAGTGGSTTITFPLTNRPRNRALMYVIKY